MPHRRRLALPFVIASLLGISPLTVTPSFADVIAIVGTGRVANALGPQFAKQGHRIIYGSRTPDREEVRTLVAATHPTATAMASADAVRDADIVVLAVPWTAAEAVVKDLGDLSGKIIIDPTNPYNRGEPGLARLVVDTSAGELIQGWAPGAHVVKAFNTMSSAVMADPASAGGPVTVPLVGNDEAAKAKVASIITAMGLEAVDLGPIRYAHFVEGMLVLWANARSLGTPFNYHLRPQP